MDAHTDLETETPTEGEASRQLVDYLAIPLAPFVVAWDGLKAVGTRFFDLASWLDPAKGLTALGRRLRPLAIRIAALFEPFVAAAHRVVGFLFGWLTPLSDAVLRAVSAMGRVAKRIGEEIERATRSLRQAVARSWSAATGPARWIRRQSRRVWAAATAFVLRSRRTRRR